MGFYSKDLTVNCKVRMTQECYDYLKHVSDVTGKCISIVAREIIEKEIRRNGYKKTDLNNYLEY